MERILPNHIAIIMDGNGRWAKKRNRPRTYGHKKGADALRKVLTYATKIGLKYLTVYAFSTENWKRSQEEVSALMTLFKMYLKGEEKNIMENNIKFIVSGSRKNVDPKLLEAITKLENLSKDNTGTVFNMAFNYGGRDEIVDAVNDILKSDKKEITKDDFEKYLYSDIPDPDLVIRTSGEFRISNFLLWQSAYSEFYITQTLWPDFDEEELEKAIVEYNNRDRRFGGVKC